MPRRHDGTDCRGSNADRHRRRQWLVDTFGDGTKVKCSWCSKSLTTKTLTVDRHPTPGHKGGTYRRGNIVPACRSCNRARQVQGL